MLFVVGRACQWKGLVLLANPLVPGMWLVAQLAYTRSWELALEYEDLLLMLNTSEPVVM